MAHFRKYCTSKGETKYRAEIRIKGAKPYSRSFNKLSDAKQWAKEQDEKVQRQAAGLYTMEDHTLAEAIDRYNEEYVHIVKNCTNATALRFWKEELGDRYMTTIRPYELIALRRKLSVTPKMGRRKGSHDMVPLYHRNGEPKMRAAATVQSYMDVLSVVYNKALKEWEWVTHNPLMNIPKIKVNNERTRFLSDHFHVWPGETKPLHWDDLTDVQKVEAAEKFPRAYEFPRLVDALLDLPNNMRLSKYQPMWAYYLFIIQISCGLRFSEATHMVWEENDEIAHPIVIADMKRAVLYLKSTKKDQTPRIKPIPNEAMEVLHKLYAERRFDTAMVFPREDGTAPLKFENRLQRAVRAAGLQDFRWHDLRHTTASYLSMMGAGQKEIMDALHHKSFKSSQRYQHLTSEHLRKLLNKFSATVLTDKDAPSRFSI